MHTRAVALRCPRREPCVRPFAARLRVGRAVPQSTAILRPRSTRMRRPLPCRPAAPRTWAWYQNAEQIWSLPLSVKETAPAADPVLRPSRGNRFPGFPPHYSERQGTTARPAAARPPSAAQSRAAQCRALRVLGVARNSPAPQAFGEGTPSAAAVAARTGGGGTPPRRRGTRRRTEPPARCSPAT